MTSYCIEVNRFTQKALNPMPSLRFGRTSRAMNATIVQATDDATILSATQRASSSSGSTPIITMSWTGQSNAAIGGPWDRYETTPDELPPEYVHFEAHTDMLMLIAAFVDAAIPQRAYQPMLSFTPFLPMASTACSLFHLPMLQTLVHYIISRSR
jgi:hypothetical protein